MQTPYPNKIQQSFTPDGRRRQDYTKVIMAISEIWSVHKHLAGGSYQQSSQPNERVTKALVHTRSETKTKVKIGETMLVTTKARA